MVVVGQTLALWECGREILGDTAKPMFFFGKLNRRHLLSVSDLREICTGAPVKAVNCSAELEPPNPHTILDGKTDLILAHREGRVSLI